MSQFPETETRLRQKTVLKYKHKDIKKEMRRTWNGKTKVITSYNRSKWRHLRRVQKIYGEHIGEARYQETTENSHTGHLAHILRKLLM